MTLHAPPCTLLTPRAETIDNKSCNTVFWSPKGRHVVVATLGSSQRFDLEFYDVTFGEEVRQGSAASDPAEEVRLIGSGEHYGITDLEWDPSGRFVSSSASTWRHQLENGYAVWTFSGKELQKQVQDRFKQILWRPRPRTLLSKEQMKNVRRNLRDIGKQFEEEDAAEESNLALANREQYERALDEWRAYRARSKQELEELRAGESSAVGPPQRRSLLIADLGREATDLPEQLAEEATEEIQEWLEETLEETEEVVI